MIREEVIIQIIRVEEPVTLAAIWRRLPGAKLGDVDKLLWELSRQGRIHHEPREREEVWFYGKSH